MVFEVLGDNLLALIKRFNYRGVPLPVVRHLTRQMLIGLDYLHRECQVRGGAVGAVRRSALLMPRACACFIV